MNKFTDEQTAAVHSIECNTVVSAGAGSGKTSVLVERFLYLLQSCDIRKPLNVQDILAITFTRKAALEMRQRLRTRLTDFLHEDSGRRDYWQKQLLNLDRASIGTIHGLCNSILKSNPVESGLDPAYIVAEENEAETFFDDENREFLRRQLHDKDQSAISLSQEYGSVRLLTLLRELFKKDAWPQPGEDLLAPYRQAAAEAESAQKRLSVQCENEMGGLLSPGNQVLLTGKFTKLKTILAQPSLSFTDRKFLEKTLGKLTLRSKADKELVQSLKQDLQLVLGRPALLKAQELMPHWVAYVRTLKEKLAVAKNEAGMLTFNDLELRALELLRQYPEVLAKCRERYKFIMVDEFQDTNERQRRLIYLLAGGREEHLLGRRLFVVGDPKQSIYRFRGAEVQVFSRVRQEIVAQGGRDIVLKDNFRSTDRVLAFCNLLFSQLLAGSRQHQLSYESLNSHLQGNIQPVLWLLDYEKSQRSELRRSEGRLMAAEIIRLHDAEGVAFQDIDILLRTMNQVEIYASRLQDAHIPYVIVDGRGFYERQEIIDLINLYAAVLHPEDNKSLTGTLRSPFFGVSDQVLTELYLQEGDADLWSRILNYSGADPQLIRAVRLLQELHLQANGLSLPDFNNLIADKLQLEADMLMQPHGAEKWANCCKLMEAASDFAQKGGSLSGWTEYLSRCRSDGVREPAATLPADGAVTLMTIHKSKGLEADTVFLPALDAGTAANRTQISYLAGTGLGIPVCNEQEELEITQVLQQIKETDKELEKEEGSRLLYVGMTRAKRRLYLLGGRQVSKSGIAKSSHWLQDIQQSVPEDDPHWGCRIFTLPLKSALKTFGTTEISVIKPTVDLAFLEPLPQYGSVNATYFSASALQSYLYCQRRYYYETIQKILPFAQEDVSLGKLPNVISGGIAHRTLELYDGKNLKTAFLEAVRDYIPGQEKAAEPILDMLERYLASPLYESFCGRPQKKELRIQLPLTEDGSLQMTGYIDVLVANEDGTFDIIDYKTGKPPEKDPGTGYAYQLAFYCMAVERSFGKKIRKASLHFLRNDSEWILPPGNWLQEATALCQEMAAKKQEDDYKTDLGHCVFCPFAYMCRR